MESSMPGLISLVCPSCGGKLQVSACATSLTCQHCGNKHLVKHDDGVITLEAFTRCPQCDRNDKSEKVTAVMASKSQEISGSDKKIKSLMKEYLLK
jgi:DNA-directed RNA polymerase subunit RPC12/RpoP